MYENTNNAKPLAVTTKVTHLRSVCSDS